MVNRRNIGLILFLIVAIGVPAIVLVVSLFNPHPAGRAVAGIASIPLMIFLFSRAYLGWKDGPRTSGAAFGLAGIALSGLAIAGFVMLVQYEQQRQPLVDAMTPVCQGKTNPESPAYTAGQRAPLMAIDVAETQHSWSSLPDMWGWEPKTPDEVVLVACIMDHDVELQACAYGVSGGKKIPLYQNQVAVYVVEAASGARLGEQVFLGEELECLDSVSSNATSIQGKDVAQDEVKTWLESFVTGARNP